MKKLKILLSACFLSSCIFMTLPAAAQDKTYRPDTVVTEITNRNLLLLTLKRNVRLYRASFSNQYGLESRDTCLSLQRCTKKLKL